MALIYWTGTTSTDPTVGTNWSGGSVPTASDDVLFDDRATREIANGSMTNDVASLTVDPSFPYSAGASGGALLVNSTGHFLLRPGGTSAVYISPKSGGTITRITVDADSTANPAVTLGGAATRTITTCIMTRGRIAFVAGTTFTNIFCAYRTNPLTDVTLTIPAGVAALTSYVQSGGEVTSGTIPGTAKISGGRFTQAGPTSGTITQIELKDTGVYELTEATHGITITALSGDGRARFDARRVKSTLTITNTTINSEDFVFAISSRVVLSNAVRANINNIRNWRIDIGRTVTFGS